MIVAFFPGVKSAADNPLSFIAVNDTLPPELINAAVTYGGSVYVPYWLFTNYGLGGITYSFFVGNSTAYLSNADKQLFFELLSGKTYDEDDYQYSIRAIYQGGTVYLPLSFMCSFFGGFSYSTIGGNEYGSILRICTGAEILTNDEFLRVAKPAMKRYYDSYNKAAESPVPSATPTPTVTPGLFPGNDDLPHAGDVIHLGFYGLPSQETLNLFRRLNMKAAFFLSEDEVRENPDMVRRICGEGFGIGVHAVSEEHSGTDTMQLIWETARVRTVMVLYHAESEAEDGMAAFFYEEPVEDEQNRLNDVYELTAKLELSEGDTTVFFPGEAGSETQIGMLLYYLRDQGFSVVSVRETDAEN